MADALSSAPPPAPSAEGVQRQDLEKTVTHLLEEARMVLPGIQALFGFQLVAVFNNAFVEQLTHREKSLHLLATALIAVCMGLVLAPVAYHRQVEPCGISQRLVTYSTWMLTTAQAFLMVALCIDFHVVSRHVLGDEGVSRWIALILLLFFATLWFFIPWVFRALQATSMGRQRRRMR